MRMKTTLIGFFDAMGEESVNFIVEQTELTTIFCAKEYVDRLIKMKNEGKLKSLENILCFDGDLTSEQKS